MAEALAALHGYPPELVKDIQDIIDAANLGTLAPNTALADIEEILKDKHIVRLVDLHPDEIACHPDNRGSFGLNAYNVHKNGAEIDKVGCDLAQIKNATCFELCPIEPKKSFQLDFNRRLISGSKGLLAPLTGRERAASVGTGHFTAWCRAIGAGCKTPFKQVADQTGHLNIELFSKKDKRMHKCVTVGFTWTFFPWQCELAWTGLPALAQRALNSSHGVSSRSTELEVMVWVAEGDYGRGDRASFDEMVESLRNSGPACAPYIDSVGKLAILIGGGIGAPTLHFLDRFSKVYGESKTLGQEFVAAVVALDMSKTQKCACLRAAMIATNLVSDKVVDGISKLLVKHDVESVRSVRRKELAFEADAAIMTGMSIIEAACLEGQIEQEQSDHFIGMLMVRMVLVMFDKQKLSPEGREFKDYRHVKCELVKSIRIEI